MAILETPTLGLVIAGGHEAGNASLHVTQKPIPHNNLGHYRVAIRCALVNAQAANSRLFELRNTGTNLIVITRLNIRWLQTGAHTAAIEDSIDCFKLTGFSAVDTVNTVTPAVSVKRGSNMAGAPGGVAIRHVTVAGAAAGMTAGTMTKDGSAFASLPKWLLAALPTASEVKSDLLDALDDVNGSHPFSFANNEGFEIENRALLGAAAGSSVYIDLAYAEVPNY